MSPESQKKPIPEAPRGPTPPSIKAAAAVMHADEHTAIQRIQQARFSSDPNSVSGSSVTLKALRDWEQKAAEVYTAEQGGVRLGVSERTAQFVDLLITRMAEKPATREAMMRDASTSIDHARRALIEARMLEDKIRSDPASSSAAREEAKETRKAAEYSNSWDVVPSKDSATLRQLGAERSADLMAAVAVAITREQHAPTAENRYRVATIEEELNYRRREVASGLRSPDDMRPTPLAPERRQEASRVLDGIPAPASMAADRAKSNEPESMER